MSAERATSFSEAELFGESPKGQVLPFPQKGDRIQDIILNLILKGESYEEISRTTGHSVENVKKFARCEWAKQELTKRLQESSPEGESSTIRNILRVVAFDAVNALSDCLVCNHPPTKLNAAKYVIDKVLPSEGSKLSSGRSDLKGLTPEMVRKRLAELEEQINHELQNSTSL